MPLLFGVKYLSREHGQTPHMLRFTKDGDTIKVSAGNLEQQLNSPEGPKGLYNYSFMQENDCGKES